MQENQYAASSRTVEIVFDPARLETEPFSFSPEKVELESAGDTRIEFVLKTSGSKAEDKAVFTRSGFIDLPQGLESAQAELENCCTRGSLCIPEGDGTGSYPYQVRAEYEGRVYTSSGWPVLIDPPVIDP